MEQIQIEQGFGQIGMMITPPDLRLHVTQPDMQLQVRPCDLELRIEQPEVIIDLRQSFDSMGLQDSTALARSCAADARQTVMRGISRRVQEGDALAQPHGPSVGAIVAASAASERPPKELVITAMPAVPPKITARLGAVRGSCTPGAVYVQLNPGAVQGDFTWGQVDVYLARAPYIDIKA